MNLACFDFSASAIRATSVTEFLQELIINDSGAERLKAVFCLALTIGRNESTSNSFAFTEHDLALLLSVFANTLARKGGPGYALGTFCVKLIVNAILAVSTSDMNRLMLVAAQGLLQLLIGTLRLFASNSYEIKSCGGGGKDLATASAVIETLLHLSFAFENDNDLQLNYMTPDLGMIDVLKQCIEDPSSSGHAKLSSSSIRSVKILLQRLTTKSVAYPKSPVKRKRKRKRKVIDKHRHVMVSYAWSAKKQNVIDLCAQLRQLGVDVWRDEEGSACVPSMSGSTYDRMAEAIERSHTVIVCVSRSYKSSANCHMEANYTINLFRQNKLKVIFTMMEEDYHTRSSPDQIDGLLAIMVGSNLWYPLWDPSQVVTTANMIFKLLAGGAAVIDDSISQLVSPVLQSLPAVSLASATVEDSPYEKIWRLLHEERLLLDPCSMQTIFE
jgi:hypothetical protein